MDQLMQWLFAPAIMIALICSAWYSVKSRRAQDGYDRGIFRAKMNISMGCMLVFIALVQLFLSAESTLRIVIGAIFLVLGVFNLFAGLRNLSIFLTARTKGKA